MSLMGRVKGWAGIGAPPAETHDETDLSDSLMYDPRPQGEMNEMVLEAMQRTGGSTGSWWDCERMKSRLGASQC